MDRQATADARPLSQTPANDSGEDPGLLKGAGALWRELHEVAHDYLLLAALETKRAGQSLVIMIAAGVMIALLLVSAWMGALAAGVLSLVTAGVATSVAILIAVAANLVVAAALIGLILRQRRNLAFPATVRNFRMPPSEAESSP